ncbi:hypothetical protein EW146_g9900, partial [Bondarzewia mesenterica]
MTIASSSRLTPNTPRAPTSSKRGDHHDVFKPKLPLDPFAGIDYRQRDPLLISGEKLFVASTSEPRRDVVLVLGGVSITLFLFALHRTHHVPSTQVPKTTFPVPSVDELTPLLYSEQLTFSLVILATHNPPSLPPKAQPAIRILRLATPLGLEQNGAVRLVNIFEWAERVARTWRKHGGIGTREHAEGETAETVGALVPPPQLYGVYGQVRSSPPSPLSSTVALDTQTPRSATSSTTRLSRKRHESKLPAADPSQRPFDALIHFLPSDLPEKSLLKHSILVTTISRPFLVAAIPPSLARPVPHSSSDRRKSILWRLSSSHSVYATPPSPPMSSRDSLSSLVPTFATRSNLKAHLIHLLPEQPKSSSRSINRIVQSIESFLLSFSFPSLAMHAQHIDGLEHARAFLLHSSALNESVQSTIDMHWTVADVILSGCLDLDEKEHAELQTVPRAWFSGASDILVSPTPSTPAQLPTLSSARTRSPPSAYSQFAHHLPDEHRSPLLTPAAKRWVMTNALPTPPDSEESENGDKNLLGADVYPHAHGSEKSRTWKFLEARAPIGAVCSAFFEERVFSP